MSDEFVLVPREPTQAMLGATMFKGTANERTSLSVLAYKAMLAAAPPAAQPSITNPNENSNSLVVAQPSVDAWMAQFDEKLEELILARVQTGIGNVTQRWSEMGWLKLPRPLKVKLLEFVRAALDTQTAQPSGFERECSDIDRITSKLGLTLEQSRTEGGSLNVPRILNHIQETLDALAVAHSSAVAFSDKYSQAARPSEHVHDITKGMANAQPSNVLSGVHAYAIYDDKTGEFLGYGSDDKPFNLEGKRVRAVPVMGKLADLQAMKP